MVRSAYRRCLTGRGCTVLWIAGDTVPAAGRYGKRAGTKRGLQAGTMDFMECLFCRATVELERSPLDVPSVPPDIHQIRCQNKDCNLSYHVDGTLIRIPESPDLSRCEDTRTRVKNANKAGIPIALCCSVTEPPVVIREYPDLKAKTADYSN